MRHHDFWILASGLIGLVFAILTLAASSRKGVMNNFQMASFDYEISSALYAFAGSYWNSSARLVPDDATPWGRLVQDNIHWFFFTASYLALCGGYVGGTEDPIYIITQCESKPGGWRFRSDDPFIINYMSWNGSSAVNSTVSFQTFSTAPPFATLSLGLIFSVLSIGTLTAEMFGGWSKSGRLSQASALISWVAVISITISSALLDSLINRLHSVDDSSWTTLLELLTWTAVGFMCISALYKVTDLVVRKEKRRRLLTTGQI